jgi:hypothetical protein
MGIVVSAVQQYRLVRAAVVFFISNPIAFQPLCCQVNRTAYRLFEKRGAPGPLLIGVIFRVSDLDGNKSCFQFIAP